MGGQVFKKKVVVKGPVLTQSGYGVHSRQVAKWLLDQPQIEVKFMATPWGDTPWILDKNSNDGLVAKIMNNTVGPEYKADVSFQIQLPNEWDSKLATENVGITAAVETDRSNPEWVSACNNMSVVVFPSEHAKKSITNAGELTTKSFVIPESYAEEIRRENVLELPEITTDFNFLLFGQLTGNNPYNDRKNLLFTIKWICEAFKDDPDVGIVLKTNSGRNTRIDRNLVSKVISTVLSEVRKGPYPKVHLVHGEMSDLDVAGLYRSPKIKALVSLTRGEGYGLPILEAAASGLPTIVTGWSGHTEFLKDIKFVSVDYNLTQVHPSRIDGKIFMPTAKWAEPIEQDFKKKILKFKSSSSVPKKWAVEGSLHIQEKYSFNEISKMYSQLLGSYLQ
jgi:glycosyltransferase involved in cell wall biosynthesis